MGTVKSSEYLRTEDSGDDYSAFKQGHSIDNCHVITVSFVFINGVVPWSVVILAKGVKKASVCLVTDSGCLDYFPGYN